MIGAFMMATSPSRISSHCTVTVHFRGHVLTVVSDCSYSGNWINACCEYLDEQGVKPCGHSVQERGIPLKVYTSCHRRQ